MQEEIRSATIREMVCLLQPDWTVREHSQMDLGIDSVYELAVDTPTGHRRVVLKAITSDTVPAAAARAEPRIMELVGSETSIPVPSIHGIRDDHPEYPTPFYLMDFVEGDSVEDDIDQLTPTARERIVSTAGQHLAEIHELGTWSRTGRIGYENDSLQVLTTDDGAAADTRSWLHAHVDDALDTFDEGGYFPDYADDPERFADLASPLREYLHEAIRAMPEPAQPRWAHGDYRYGNLLLDTETGAIHGVVDWGLLSAHDPAYNLTVVESMLTSPEEDGQERATTLRERFRRAYKTTRQEWAFDDATRERIDLYRLVYRLDAMACLPLWYKDATPAERDERAREHREFVRSYLD